MFNPLLIIFGIIVSAISGLSSGSKPKPQPTPIPIVAVSPSPGTPIPTAVSVPALALSPTPEVKGEQTQEVLVTGVTDGDTIEIEGGKKVRYIGIDTPETVDPRKSVQCFGHEASNKNKELVLGKKVRLEKDVSETDKYGRLLRYVWVGDTFVNDYLVRQGYAQSSTYPPDVKYQNQFLQAQKEAREQNRGLWSVCSYFGEPEAKATPKVTPKPQPTPSIPLSGYSCDCSRLCDQISTCEEAYYQLNTCGCSARDSDKDGIPCESLCSGGNQSATSLPSPTQPPAPPADEGGYTCDCSKACTRISSCAEAYYQLNNCGCSARDGDKDGVPCESLCQ